MIAICEERAGSLMRPPCYITRCKAGDWRWDRKFIDSVFSAVERVFFPPPLFHRLLLFPPRSVLILPVIFCRDSFLLPATLEVGRNFRGFAPRTFVDSKRYGINYIDYAFLATDVRHVSICIKWNRMRILKWNKI